MKILFTGGGGAGNEAIFRLWENRYDLHFADADPAAISPVIPEARRHAIALAADENFAAGLVDLCRSLNVDVLIPGVDEELPHMGGLADFAHGLSILVPDAAYVAAMLDKQSMADCLADKGLPVPNTRPLEFVDDLGFPCFAKPRFGRGSRGVSILVEKSQAELLRQTCEEDYVVQELLSGQEYTVLMAADRTGHLGAIVPVRVDVKRGITVRAATDHNETVMTVCQAIHHAMPTHGCYNIQLMLEDDGRVMPFEINPRISTTFCLALAAGIDPVEIFLNGAGDVPAPFIDGLRLNRSWTNYFEQHDYA